ncbi:MAG: alpha/beta hydrolase, partial [Chloroflexi bacterium]|nr:alpha/beta hydrolase [Chloroflexota bacterium]
MAFQEQDISFNDGDIRLAGTLLLPETPGPHPATVFIHGSGRAVRNDYRITAAHFADQGIAGLIYGKRGCGESDRDWLTMADMEHSFPLWAEDAAAGLYHLKSHPEIDPQKIGFWGLSQGGWIGLLAASKTPEAASVISASGPGVGGHEQMDFYIQNRLASDGCTREEIEHALTERKRTWDLVREIAVTGQGWTELKELVLQASQTNWVDLVPAFLVNDIDSLESNLRPFIEILAQDPDFRYDPVPALEGTTCPVLAIWGDADTVVPVEKSVAIYRESLDRGGNDDLTIRVFPDAGHGLRLGDGSMAPGYIEAMTDWLRARMGNKPTD